MHIVTVRGSDNSIVFSIVTKFFYLMFFPLSTQLMNCCTELDEILHERVP